MLLIAQRLALWMYVCVCMCIQQTHFVHAFAHHGFAYSQKSYDNIYARSLTLLRLPAGLSSYLYVMKIGAYYSCSSPDLENYLLSVIINLM